MNPNIYDLINKSDVVAENRVLNQTIISGKVNVSVRPEYFTGNRKALYEEILEQWNKYKSFDDTIINDNHPEAFMYAIEADPSCSDIIIESLYKTWLIRESSRKVVSIEYSEDKILESLQELQADISGLVHKNSNQKYNHSVEVLNLLDVIEAGHKSGRSIRGYSTRIDEIDNYTSGIEKGKVYALGALKKCGKSSFAIYLSLVLRSQNANVFWNSLEMSKEQLNMKALSYYSGINSSSLGSALTKNQYCKLAEGAGCLNELNWQIYRDYTVSDLKARILGCKVKPDVVVIDYIQRMRSDRYKGDRTRELENVAQDLADMSRELDIAIIELSQLQGVAEKLDKEVVPDMSHFKESQGIPEAADQIWTLHNSNRHESPFDGFGNYIPQSFQMRIEQRYDVSGKVCKFFGDMRLCKFYE
jgi:replicative DNA helicase